MKLIDFYEKKRLTEEERNRLGKLGILTDKEEITVLDLLGELPKTIPSTDFVDQGRPLEYNLGIRFNQSGGMIAYHMRLPDGDGVLFSPLYFGLTPTGETVQFIDALFTEIIQLAAAGKIGRNTEK